jgi:hypothetical protein
MALVRYLIGILLAGTGLSFGVGALGLLVQPDPEIPMWQVGAMFVILGRFPLLGAFVLLRPSLIRPAKPCSQCGSGERQPAGVARQYTRVVDSFCAGVASDIFVVVKSRETGSLLSVRRPLSYDLNGNTRFSCSFLGARADVRVSDRRQYALIRASARATGRRKSGFLFRPKQHPGSKGCFADRSRLQSSTLLRKGRLRATRTRRLLIPAQTGSVVAACVQLELE